MNDFYRGGVIQRSVVVHIWYLEVCQYVNEPVCAQADVE